MSATGVGPQQSASPGVTAPQNYTMGWKQYAATVESELKQERAIVASLRQQLAEREEQIGANGTFTDSHSASQDQELLSQIAEKDRRIERLFKDVAVAQEQAQNGQKQTEHMKRDCIGETKKLESQIDELTTQLRKKTTEKSPNKRETELSEQVTAANGEVQRLRNELLIAKKTVQDLMRQLQAEKVSSMRKYSFVKNKCDKSGCEGDEDEPLLTTPKTLASKCSLEANATDDRPRENPLKNIQQAVQSPADMGMVGLSGRNAQASYPGLGNSNQHDSAPATPFEKFEHSPEMVNNSKIELKDTPAPSKKRKLRKEKELALEMAELGPISEPLGLRMRIRNRISHGPRSSTTGSPNLDGNTDPFDFIAVCTYDTNGGIDTAFTADDLRGVTPDLWERIKHCVVNIWTKYKGEDWQWEFQQPSYKPKRAVCVTTKCGGKGRTPWHRGEEGKYACRDCVRHDRPCFAYVLKEWPNANEEKGEFRLLPLREQDREMKVENGFETRYWMNDGNSEIEEVEESDDEYMEAQE